MEAVYFITITGTFMKENGLVINRTGRGNLYILMGITISGSFLRIKRMEKECIFGVSWKRNIKGIG